VGNEGHRIPVKVAIAGSAGGGGGDTDEGDESKDDGEEGNVDELPLYRDTGIA